MKYTTEREQNLNWIALSSLWAAGGLLAWLFSLVSSITPVEGATVAFLAAIVAGVGVALRLPIITGTPHSHELSDHVVLLLGYVATVNWFGCLVNLCPSMLEAIPVLLILASTECWLHGCFRAQKCLTWARYFASHGKAKLRSTKSRLLNKRSAPVMPHNSDPENPLELEASLASPNAMASKIATPVENGSNLASQESEVQATSDVRTGSCFDGVDEHGRRFLSGELCWHLPPKQKAEDVVIGFCPPFEQIPEVEFEVNNGDVSARLANCTQTGMRLQIRRSAGTEDNQKSAFELQWYAVQSEGKATTPAGRVLP